MAAMRGRSSTTASILRTIPPTGPGTFNDPRGYCPKTIDQEEARRCHQQSLAVLAVSKTLYTNSKATAPLRARQNTRGERGGYKPQPKTVVPLLARDWSAVYPGNDPPIGDVRGAAFQQAVPKKICTSQLALQNLPKSVR